MIYEKHHPKYLAENTGNPKPLDTLRSGSYFRYPNLNLTYNIHSIEPNHIKIKKPCGWITRIYFDNPLSKQIVYEL